VVGAVPPGATMVGVPAKQVSRGKEKAKEAFLAYGTPDKIPDPVQRALDGLLDQVSSLGARVEELERLGKDDADLAEPVAAEGRALGRRTGRG
jgi:serine O-acetyltransferase